jgi:hypothetical protein
VLKSWNAGKGCQSFYRVRAAGRPACDPVGLNAIDRVAAASASPRLRKGRTKAVSGKSSALGERSWTCRAVVAQVDVVLILYNMWRIHLRRIPIRTRLFCSLNIT